jgi:hypothetical protein
MMDREPKDWVLGQRIFGRLATLEPRRACLAHDLPPLLQHGPLMVRMCT